MPISAFLWVGANVQRGLTTGDQDEAALKQVFEQASAELPVLATADKIGHASSWVITEIYRVTTLVTQGNRPAWLPSSVTHLKTLQTLGTRRGRENLPRKTWESAVEISYWTSDQLLCRAISLLLISRIRRCCSRIIVLASQISPVSIMVRAVRRGTSITSMSSPSLKEPPPSVA